MPGVAAELRAEDIHHPCDPTRFAFTTTTALPPLTEVLGQPRAVAALEVAAATHSQGFNLFAAGLPGSGKTTLILEHLQRYAATQPVPPDLCYTHNFEDGRRPRLLRVPPGCGARLKADMETLVRELQIAIPRAFDSVEYGEQRDRIRSGLEERRAAVLAEMEAHVKRYGFQLIKTPGGLLLAPVVDGTLITEKEQEHLAPEQVDKLAAIRERLDGVIESGVRKARELDRATQAALRDLDAQTARFAIEHLVDDLRGRYADVPPVGDYLDAVQADVVTHADDFRPGTDPGPAASNPFGPPPTESPFLRYRINILVDNRGLVGAPVILENNPTYHNLIGRIEHKTLWNAVVTDFTHLKPGALQRANGGYLILPARECLLNPYAWEGLKRSLKDRAVRIEELGSQLSLVSTETLEPEPSALDIKIVLIGHPALYQLLANYDEDFKKLFKIRADFASDMDRTPESEDAYARFINTIARQESGPPFDPGGVARVIDYGARAVGDQERLSTRFGEIADLVREAEQQAIARGQTVVSAADVRAAERARRYRGSLGEQRFQEAITRGELLLDTDGAAIGQVNGLAVAALGEDAFGHPARITAVVGPGQRGVVSIEREVDLSGPIHGKGVLILSGYLLRRYGAARQLSLSASLVFEQSYGLIDGDSATLAELTALLSALADVPIRQDLAVTGSVNQHGQLQPVGGVTDKVEGFFDVCDRRGLTGTQGVLLPSANRRHLMVREDIVAAVRAGRFHVWVADDVDGALRVLTAVEPGAPDARGRFAARTLHGRVATRLAGFARALRSARPESQRPTRTTHDVVR